MYQNTITLSCKDDLANFLSKSQHYLGAEFAKIEGIRGVWEGRIRSGGQFPLSTGFAARHSILGFNRARQSQITFLPMVGHQDDCVASCNSQPEKRRIQAVDHIWYRVMNHAEYTEPFCLKTMWQEAFNLKEQIQNIWDNLKQVTMDINDEFSRTSQVTLSQNRWLGVDDGTNSPKIAKKLWRFEQDSNGNYNVNKIILDPSVSPSNIGLLSVDVLNRVRQAGMYNGAFPAQGPIDVITDYDTADYLPKMDTNVRADNRYRQPEVLNPGFGVVKSYANYNFVEDPFALRYYWDLNDPKYPNGVLTRIDQWASNPVAEGCFDDVSDDYLNADFQITIPFRDVVWSYQTTNYPNSVPGMNFEQPFSPYDGMWKFINDNNPITPCNLERNLGFWMMVWEMAAKPDRPQLGHVILHRRFNVRGVTKSCRSLMVPTGGSYSCVTACPPLNHYPPALLNRKVCGKWNKDGVCTQS